LYYSSSDSNSNSSSDSKSNSKSSSDSNSNFSSNSNSDSNSNSNSDSWWNTDQIWHNYCSMEYNYSDCNVSWWTQLTWVMVYHKPSYLVILSNDSTSFQTITNNGIINIYFPNSSSLNTLMNIEIQKTQWSHFYYFPKPIMIKQFSISNFKKPIHFVLLSFEI